jgi:Cd2+/Zn2+-exporting ATPase
MIGRHSDLSVYKEIFKSSDFLRIVLGGALIPITLGLSKLSSSNTSLIISGLLLLSVTINGMPIILEAFQGIIKKKINVDELVSIAIIACLINGNFLEAATVSFIMVFGAMIEEAVSDSARKSIQGLIEVTPDVAIIEKDGREIRRKVSELSIGDIVLVRPGDTIPVDGQLIEGMTSVDESSLTGESIPIDKVKGSNVSAGSINIEGFIKLSACKIGQDSTIGKVIELVKSAEQSKVDGTRIVDKYATFFTPFILLVAVLTFIITREMDRAITVLIVGCPCSFLLAGPVATVAAIGRASKAGILVKGGSYLEKIATAKGFYFDKTGTVTSGNPKVVEVVKTADYTEKQIVNMAANVEYGSRHPLAKSILLEAEKLNCLITCAKNILVENGKGVSGKVDDKIVWVGSTTDSKFLDRGITFVTVKVDEKTIGHIGIFDQARPEAKKVMEYLNANNADLAIISGDQESAVSAIARQIGIKLYYAGLKPDEKMDKINHYKNGPLVYIGDGINDAPALKISDVGIAMGLRGSDVALETADIVLLNDKIERLPFLIRLSRRMSKTIKISIAISLIINLLSLIAGSMGLLTPILGAISHNIGSIAVVLLSASISFEKY